MKIFDPDSPLMQGLGKLCDILFCNVMFILFSMPVFTIGASMTALCSCMMKLIEEKEDELVARDFWRAFKKNFKQATAIWLLLLLVILVLVGFFFVANAVINVLGRMYLLPYFLLVFLFLCGVQYVFPILARYQLRIRDVLKNAWLISIAALPWTICALGVCFGWIFLTFVTMSVDMCLFLWAFFGFGLVVYLSSFFYRKAFQKLDPAVAALAHTSSDEAIFTDESHDDGRAHLFQASGYSNPDWNRRDYPLSDRSDVQGKGSNKNFKPRKKR